MKRFSQRGVALVITLIMLAVITVMAVAFLALSRRERASVANAGPMADSQLMADAALERAKGIAIGSMLATSNLLAPDLTVSRNYINPNGFDPAAGANPFNVNYDYTINKTPLNSQNDLIQNIANLFFDPRPPVFINYDPTKPLDFRFYLDLNRNGRFDTNGLLPAFDELGNMVGTNLQFFVGDPEWIGVPERPNLPHSPTNKYMGRYAFLIQPIGTSLDLNFIGNHGKETLDKSLNGFYRNQGFGPWEINLAAFLADLNTNQWDPPAGPYLYETNLTSPSTGIAFDDARELLNYRYRGDFKNLLSVRTLFGPPGGREFRSDYIDGYANGLLDANNRDNDDFGKPWPGADSVQHFFSVHDFSRVAQPPNYYTNFINRLAATSARRNSYDRYTFYRLLAQMGTDSGNETPRATLGKLMQKISANVPGEFIAEPVGKINLNYDNIDHDAGEFVSWDPAKFFTNVANVLLRSQFGFGVTNIPIYPTNYYSPAVHRLLQLAANIYDTTSTTNGPPGACQFPSVFRPTFGQNGTNVFITGYYFDNDAATVDNWITNNPYGIPMVVGAKKGIPNFNEYAMQTAVQVSRKLELVRADTNQPPRQTNEMFMIGVSNFCGLEAWNSYTQAFACNLEMRVGSITYFTLTNSGATNGQGLSYTFTDAVGAISNISAGTWLGLPQRMDNAQLLSSSFKVPLSNSVVVLSDSVYRPGSPPSLDSATNVFTVGSGFSAPDWKLIISNRVTYVLSSGGKILDFVILPNLTNTLNISGALMGGQVGPALGEDIAANCWKTNRAGNSLNPNVPTTGVQNQMDISLGVQVVSDPIWQDFGGVKDKQKAIDSFQAFVMPQMYSTRTNSNLAQQAPFSPTRKLVQTIRWQVNDPLVHYLPDHLRDVTNNIITAIIKSAEGIPSSSVVLGSVNSRYQPWGANADVDPNASNLAVKDPGVTRSDDWDFPTNKYPNIGWLGRVHRGTPWQTVYLKSEVASQSDWAKQALDPFSHPTNDWRLLDMFTVAPYPLASRGQLSINQTNLAAWSAVLSGVTVLTNLPSLDDMGPPFFQTVVVQPNSPELFMIVDGINKRRSQLPGQTFRRLGELLSVPELTVNSPFLNQSDDTKSILNDAAYEQIPQQILSLLKLGDARFVIYAFGQSLKPAPNSILTSGTYAGMCTNYQITGEVVTRSVLRIDGTAAKPRPVLEKFNLLTSD